MSPVLAALLWAGATAALIALWLNRQINRAVTWRCPCGGC